MAGKDKPKYSVGQKVQVSIDLGDTNVSSFIPEKRLRKNPFAGIITYYQQDSRGDYFYSVRLDDVGLSTLTKEEDVIPAPRDSGKTISRKLGVVAILGLLLGVLFLFPNITGNSIRIMEKPYSSIVGVLLVIGGCLLGVILIKIRQ